MKAHRSRYLGEAQADASIEIAARVLQRRGGQPLGCAGFDVRLNKAAAVPGMSLPVP